MEVVLIDSGGANIGSVQYALERLGARSKLTADAEAIAKADRVILPGVGAAGAGMARLRELGLIEVILGLSQPLLGRKRQQLSHFRSHVASVVNCGSHDWRAIECNVEQTS